MEKDNYKARLIDNKIETYLRLFGAITIEGPKYCGKTWAARKHAKSESLLYIKTGEESNEAMLAKIKPDIILDGEKPKLIDEWQIAPNLWDAVRYKIDETGLKGQYILTGSSTPNKMKKNHSGAGRFGKIKLRTMSLYESGDSSGELSLEDICNGKEICKSTGEVNLNELAHLIIRGGWPANLDYSSDDALISVKEYINLIIEDDLDRIDNIKRDKHKFKLLLKSLARNESTTATIKTLHNDIIEKDFEDIDTDTVSSYIDVLDRLFLIDNDEPFSANIRSKVKVKQAEKRHFADPSIACALLNITEEKMINDLNTFGFLFESMVERDLKIYADTFNGNVYHYQDYKNREIDSVIELEDGSWCAFEIKLGANQIEEAAKKLIDFKTKTENEGGKAPSVLGVICGLTNAAYVRPDGVYVFPITALKN